MLGRPSRPVTTWETDAPPKRAVRGIACRIAVSVSTVCFAEFVLHPSPPITISRPR